jgi:hypothetical protein
MSKFIFGFVVGMVISHLLLAKGIDLPQRLDQAINRDELKRLGQDIKSAFGGNYEFFK